MLWSRFHLLADFDDGKWSCWKRLASSNVCIAISVNFNSQQIIYTGLKLKTIIEIYKTLEKR